MAVNSNGVTWDRNLVTFTFTDETSSEEQTLDGLFYQAYNPNYPQNFRYTIEMVNRTHAGTYRAKATSKLNKFSTYSLTVNIGTAQQLFISN